MITVIGPLFAAVTGAAAEAPLERGGYLVNAGRSETVALRREGRWPRSIIAWVRLIEAIGWSVANLACTPDKVIE